MNKKEAANYLGISTRTLEYHQKKQRISPIRYEPGKTGDEAVYDESQLRAFKAVLQTSKRTPNAVIEPELHESPASLETLRGSVTELYAAMPEAMKLLSQGIADAVANHAPVETIADLAAKPLLTRRSAKVDRIKRRDAQSSDSGRKAKEKLIGKAYRIKREDLDSYIKKL